MAFRNDLARSIWESGATDPESIADFLIRSRWVTDRPRANGNPVIIDQPSNGMNPRIVNQVPTIIPNDLLPPYPIPRRAHVN